MLRLSISAPLNDHPRARPRLGQDLRPQQLGEAAEQPHVDDAHLAQVDIERVAVEELRPRRQALRAGRLVGLADQVLLDVHAPATHLRMAAHRGEHDAAVERTEVDHHVAVAQLRETHHAIDQLRAAAGGKRPLFLRAGRAGGRQQGGNADPVASVHLRISSRPADEAGVVDLSPRERGPT